MQVFDAFRVDLGPVGDDVVAPEQKLRQHAHAAPDLQHVAAPGSFRPLPGIRRNIRLYTRHTLRPCLLRNIPPGIRFRPLNNIPPGTRSDIQPGCNFRCPSIACDLPGSGRCAPLGSVSGPSFRCDDYDRLRLLRSSPSRSLPVRSGKSGNSRSCPQPDLSARKRVADFARDIQIDQKMLAQRLFSPYFTHSISAIHNNSRPRTLRSRQKRSASSPRNGIRLCPAPAAKRDSRRMRRQRYELSGYLRKPAPRPAPRRRS